MSKSYKKYFAINCDDGNRGRRKSFLTPAVKQAVNADRRKGYPIRNERKIVIWDREYSSETSIYKAIYSQERMCENMERQRDIWFNYVEWLGKKPDTSFNRKTFARIEFKRSREK